MKTIKNITILAFSLLLFVGCSKNDNSPEKENSTELKFTASIGEPTLTRVNGTSWENGDVIGITMTDADSKETSPINDVYNIPYSTLGNGVFNPIEGQKNITIPRDMNVNFLAYTPYSEEEELKLDFSDQSDLSKLDLLVSRINNVPYNTETIALKFDHLCSKLEYSITTGEGLTTSDLEGIVITIDSQIANATYSRSNGEISYSGEQNSQITLNTKADGTFSEGIIYPYDNISSEQPKQFHTTFKLKSGTTYTLLNKEIFESNKKIIYNVTLNKSAINVTSSLIDSWTEVTQSAGNATLQ